VVDGALTTTQPTAPNAKVLLAVVVDKANNGTILVRPTIEPKLEELQNVLITSATNGNVLSYDGTKWVNSTRLTTAESDIDALEGRMTTEEGNVDSLEGRMTTAEGDIDDIEDGTTIVPKALADQNGNVINTTYLTQSSATATYIPLSQKGVANGVAPLGADNKILSVHLPGGVDDIKEFADVASFPDPGEASIIYVALDTNVIYRWSGTAYVEISSSLALGQTSSTAFPGDRGLALETLTDNIVDGSQALALKDQVIRNTLTTTIPLVVNSIASTTANLTEFQVDGAKKLEVTKDGFLNQNGTRLFHQTGGTTNTFFGNQSGSLTASGTNNNAFGLLSLSALTSGSNNVSIGSTSGLFITSGGSNTAIGFSSGRSITTGGTNVFVGRDAGFTGAWGTQLATATNSTGIGYQAVTDKSNQMVFGNASVSEYLFGRGNASKMIINTPISTTQLGLEVSNATINTSTTLFNRNGTLTDNRGVVSSFIHNLPSGQMVDGFGSTLVFSVRDQDAVINEIGQLGTWRSGADNSGRMVFLTNNAGTMSEKMTILPDGKVGIGTASPASQLSVVTSSNADGIQIRRNSGTTNDFTTLSFAVSTGVSAESGAEIRGVRTNRATSSDTDLRFVTRSSNTNAERMTIRDDGNVGIGTSSPGTKLTLDSGDLRIQSLKSTNATIQSIVFRNTNSTGFDVANIKGITGANIFEGVLAFDTKDSGGTMNERMRILSNGNVGIGTSNPADTLHIVGATGIRIDHTADRILSFARTGANSFTFEHDVSQFYLYNTTTSASALLVKNDGSISINAGSSPTAQLQVKSGATTRVPLIVDTLASHSVNLQEWKNNNVNQVVIYSNGNIGTGGALRNINDVARSAVDLNNNGVIISRNVADSNPALITNLANASSTANIQVWQKAGVAQAWVNGSGEVAATAILNKASFQNSLITLGNAGTLIYRSSSDSNVVLKVQQNSTATTGNLQEWILGASSVVASVNKDGIANFTGTPSNAQTGDYTLVLADKGKVLRVNSSSNRTVTIPLNSLVAFPIDTEIAILRYGSGTVSISPTSGVTLQSASGNRKIKDQYGSVALKKIGENEWVLVGSLEA
jgi:hypothetical protein